MTIRNFRFLLQPRSVALIGASTQARQRRPDHGAQPAGRRLCGADLARQPQARLDRGPGLLSLRRRAARRTRPRRHRHAARDASPSSSRELGAQRDARRGRHHGGHSRRAQARDAGGGAAAPAAHPGPQLPRPDAARASASTPASRTSRRSPGDLAFVSQSGALITAIIDWARGRNIGFSHVVSLGDMADVDFGDLLDYLAGDAQSRAILLYMESVTNAPKFMSAARRAARAKPVIVVKAGRSAARRQGGALAHRRAGGRGCAPTRPRSGAPACCASASSTSCSAPPRSWRGIRRSPASGSPSSPTAAAPACSRPTGSATYGGTPGKPLRRRRDRRSMPCCRRPGRTAIRSTSSAMPTRQDMRRALEVAARERRRRRHPGDELPDGARLEHGSRAGDHRRAASGTGPAARRPKAVIAIWLGDEASRDARSAVCAQGHRAASRRPPRPSTGSCSSCAMRARRKS